MTYISNKPTVSEVSTSTLLTNGAVYTSDWVLREHPQMIMSFASDQSFTYQAQFSTNGSDVDSSLTYTYEVGTINVPRPLVIARQYYRIIITNDSGSDMTYLRAQVSVGDFGPLASKLNASLKVDADANVTRAIIAGQQPDGDYVNVRADGGAQDVNGVDIFSSTPLTAGASYTSGWADTDGFKSIEISIEADEVSADQGIIIEYTNDANTATPVVELTKTFSFNADSAAIGDLTILVPPRLDGFRLTYTNGATNQASFLMAATLRTAPVQSVELPISSPINKNTNANVTRTVSVGETPDGEFKNLVESGKFELGSTSTPLAIGAEFVGEFIDASRYTMLQIAIISDQYYDDTAYTDTQGTTGGVLLELSADGSTVAQSFALRVSEDGVAPNYFLYFTPARQWARFKYTNGDTAQTTFELSLFAYTSAIGAPVGSIGTGLSNFSLASQAKSAMYAESTDGNSVEILSFSSAGEEITNATKTLNTKAVVAAEDDAGDYGRIERYLNSLKTAVTRIEVDSAVRPSTKLETMQVNANSSTPIQVIKPLAGVMTPVRKLIINNPSGSSTLYYGNSSSLTSSNGGCILPSQSLTLELGDNNQDSQAMDDVYLLTDGAITSTQDDDLVADTVDSSTNVTNPTNAYTSNDSRADMTASDSTITLSGYDATGASLLTAVQSVMLKLEARKEPSAGTEQVAHVATVGQDAGNVTSITSPTVTSSATDFYIVSIARRDEFAEVTEITSTMGFTSFTLIGDTGTDSTESRTSMYYAVGAPTGDGTITATLSQSADHCVISISRYLNVNTSSPISGSVTLGADNSLGTYSNTVTGAQDNGMLVIAIGLEQDSHTAMVAPTGSTERFEDGSTAGNDQTMAIVDAPITATASLAFNGTVTGTNDISYVACALNPADGIDPIVTVSHSEGATVLTQTVSSETDAVYEIDITSDAAWDTATLDGATVTVAIDTIGVANLEIDTAYLRVVSSSSVTRVPITFLGDKP